MIARSLYHTMRADLRERLRRPAFLVVVALTALAGYAFVPPAGAPYTIIDLGGFRGVYNAAWLGAMLTMLLTQFVGLLGFFYVRGAIAYDIDSGVGQILGATPLRRPAYLLGKWLSGWATLGLLTAIVALMGVVMLLGRGEDRTLDLGALLLPQLVIALPTMGLVAGIATLFDAVRPLRGLAGSAAYLVLFVGGLGAGLLQAADPSGIGALMPGIGAACADIYGAACATRLSVGIVLYEGVLQTFVWPGMAWSLDVVVGQWRWAGLGLLAVLAAVPLFDGFVARWAGRAPGVASAPPPGEWSGTPTVLPRALSRVSPARHTFGRVLLAELRLLLQGQPWWWYVGAGGLIVACALSPLAVARQWLLPIAWLWPLLRWSELGTRERRYGTAPLLLSVPRATGRRLPAAWLAGATVALLLGMGAALALAGASDWPGLAGLGVTALLIPALALTLGVWSGSPRLFELVALLLWYGALNGIPALALTPTSAAQIGLRALLTAALLGLAAIGHRRAGAP